MILVTGGTGLVGAQLLYELTSEGKKVRALRRATSTDQILNMIFHEKPLLKNNIEWVEGNVTDVHGVLLRMEDGVETTRKRITHETGYLPHAKLADLFNGVCFFQFPRERQIK